MMIVAPTGKVMSLEAEKIKKSSIITISYLDISILYVHAVLIIVIYYKDSGRGVAFGPDKRTRKTSLKNHPYWGRGWLDN